MTRNQAPGLSESDRLKDIEGLAREFNEHLLETPGNVMNGHLRCAVAQCARSALQDCEGCQILSKDGPSREKAFRIIANLEHQPAFTASNDSHVSEAIVNLVHALVNHQTKLDNEWYLSTIVSLRNSRILPSDIAHTPQARQFMIWSLFCEICVLTAISHGVHMTYLVMGREAPALPRTSNTEPQLVDFNAIKRSDRDVHQNDGVAFAPYLRSSDVDINSLELGKLSPQAFQALRHNMDIYSPYVSMIFAPADLDFMDLMTDIFYVPQSSVGRPHVALDPTSRCTDHVTRHDLEVVGVAIAAAYRCDYSRSLHGSRLLGAKDGNDTNHKQHKDEILQRLAKAASCRPLDMAQVEAARNELVADYSRELLIEAAGMIGVAEAETKLSGPTGQKPLTQKTQSCMKCFFGCFKLCC
mmetsp:Transcript_3927/g.6568  ORF Transcript_3927/g.6568 Transcript_3927/m.6568 type:complete len:413 (+) Transcript_3927:60-1298(+)